VLFTREFGQRLPPLMLLRMCFTYIPYQWLLGLSALRATFREMRGRNDWEKTEHFGAHRMPARVGGWAARPRPDQAA
jgi:hypothetical protein